MFCVQCGTASVASARFCAVCGTAMAVSARPRRAVSPSPPPDYRGGASHALRFVVRLAAGAVSLALAILGSALLSDIASVDTPNWALPLAVAIHLAGGLLTFGVFFRWGWSRVVPALHPGEEAGRVVRKYERTVGAILAVGGSFAMLVAALAVVGVGGAPAPEMVAIILFLFFVAVMSGFGEVHPGRGTLRGCRGLCCSAACLLERSWL